MKTKLGVIAVVLAMCCALFVGFAPQARAAACTTQGALALALADLLGIKGTSAQEAADSLAALGVKPKLGWNVEACLTEEVTLEVKQTYAALNRDVKDVDKMLGVIGQTPDQQYPPVSPFKP